MKIGSVSLLAGAAAAAAKPLLSRQDAGSRRGSSASGETGAIPLAAHPARFPQCAAARDNHTGGEREREEERERERASSLGRTNPDTRLPGWSLVTCGMSLTTIYKPARVRVCVFMQVHSMH